VFESTLQPLLLLSAVMSVVVGSVGALNQIRIKRLLAYSAIGHMGFMLLGLATGTVSSLHGALVYFVLYIIMTVNSFAFVLTLSRDPRHPSGPVGAGGDSLLISQLSGLSRTHPVLAISFALTLLSLAGIPPLAGFLSKFLVLNQAIANG
jgi:NADH-quinone oxidoreductase subunit N